MLCTYIQAKQKQLAAVKMSAAKQSRINRTTGKESYQVVAKWTQYYQCYIRMYIRIATYIMN